MKKGLMAAGVLWLIDLVVTAVLVSLMPDQVPVHFNGGEVARLGSRFENFTVPGIARVLGALLALLAKYGDEGNRATMTKLGIGMQMLFIALSAFVCLNILSYDPAEISLGAPDTAVSKIGASIIGVTVAFMGFLMPKSKRNSAFGIRVSWTQKSDEAWERAHRFGGPVAIVGGALMLVCGLVFEGYAALAATMVVFVAWVAATLVVSYFVCKNAEG